jgi:hypothetical protein
MPDPPAPRNILSDLCHEYEVQLIMFDPTLNLMRLPEEEEECVRNMKRVVDDMQRHFDRRLEQESNVTTWVVALLAEFLLAERMLEIDMGADRRVDRARLLGDIADGIMEIIPKVHSFGSSGRTALAVTAPDFGQRLDDMSRKLEVDGINGFRVVGGRLDEVLGSTALGMTRRIIDTGIPMTRMDLTVGNLGQMPRHENYAKYRNRDDKDPSLLAWSENRRRWKAHVKDELKKWEQQERIGDGILTEDCCSGGGSSFQGE